MIAIENLTVEFSSKPLLDHITFLVNDKEKVALVGKNGAGKTTLLKIMAGLERPTSGRVVTSPDITIGYLPQHMIHNDGTTVIEETMKAFDEVAGIRRRIDSLNGQIARRTDYDSKEYISLLDTLAHQTELLNIMDAGNREGDAERTLAGLGFLRSDFNRQCSEFSGGWRMRVELAKILLRRPDVLLLDEPTNHLDIESIQWLERFLMQSPCSLLLVSHDRAFLDNVTTRTIEISLGKIYDYNVSYSHFRQLRQERHEQQVRAYQNQQKMIADTEAFIERFRYKATKAVQVQSRIKQLDKLERLEVDLEDTSRLRLRFQPAPRSGDFPLIIDGLEKSYVTGSNGETWHIGNVNITLRRGDKVAFVGKNGAGKSTLVKCIMGQITDYTGTLRIGHNVTIGYFAQNQASLLDEQLTVFDTIDRVATGDMRLKIRDILGAFMFGGEASDKKVKVLSGGERSRLAMIRLLLQPVNLLILDEPTNHLDMPSKDVLKDAIRDFTGTVILVSHDREFLDGLVQRVYEFADNTVREHIGGIYDYLAKRNIQSLDDIPPAPVGARHTVSANSQPSSRMASNEHGKNQDNADGQAAAPSANKQQYEARKELQRQIAKAQREVQKKEAEIEQAEQLIATLEAKMADPDPADNLNQITADYADAKTQLEHRMYEWEILSEQLDELQSQLA